VGIGSGLKWTKIVQQVSNDGFRLSSVEHSVAVTSYFLFRHSPPSSAKVKNGGAIPPLPRMSSWHSSQLIKHRDNFIFFCLKYLP
jgi:hypothetical protein